MTNTNQILTDMGFFNLDINALLVKEANNLKTKLAGPILIPKEELEYTMIEKKYRGQTTFEFNYNEMIHIVEKYYGFKSRGFGNLNEKVREHLIHVQEEYEKSHEPLNQKRKSAIEEFFWMWISKNVPYIDFWHSLLKSDFQGMSNGSVASLWLVDEVAEELNISDIKIDIFAMIRQIIFKEIDGLGMFGKCPEKIECYLIW